MLTTRHLARTFLRLTLPVAVLAVALLGAPAQADPQTSCVYGFHDQYFDEFGNLCASGDTCSGSKPRGCYLDFSYVSWQQDVILCYCD
ncbi:MAG TPA: hypothetical protein VEL74_22140 [Thermoanaerobaculia bacterium]|nr:hypothetical protein [Thermoanaerobaculia bacterium]